jgi:hypothetical protein
VLWARDRPFGWCSVCCRVLSFAALSACVTCAPCTTCIVAPLSTLTVQEVHSKIMTNIHRRNAGEVQGIIDPLTGEPVIPLEKEPSLAVEAFVTEKGHDSRTDVPAHALGTYLLFFGER